MPPGFVSVAEAHMARLAKFVNERPQYVFHPLRLARRAVNGRALLTGGPGESSVVRLPWGTPLEVYPNEILGASILAQRVFDPCVSETLFRLIAPGEIVLDVGANVGYMSSIMAVRAAASGEVLAFEPHPRVYERLDVNARNWALDSRYGRVNTFQLALSNQTEGAALLVTRHFDTHMGLSSLTPRGDPQLDSMSIPVETARLDDVIGRRNVGLAKIDVEGHEPEVLEGASRLLEEGRIRDVIVEAQDGYPNRTTTLLEESGYAIFGLHHNLFGVNLRAPDAPHAASGWPGLSMLATRDPGRAKRLLRPRGWQLRGIGPAFHL